jgi:hypothetical protein
VKRAELAVVLSIALLAGRAQAWEAETTAAGLAEQAALSSRLHKRMLTLGFSGGLFEPLTIPPADAPALIEDLHLLSPADGQVPDARGRQSALGWVAAGAALADVPTAAAANHFYDVATGHGWMRPDRGLFGELSDAVRGALGRAQLPARGVPAPDWVVDRTNPFNLANFLDQYAKAASAPTPGERSRHMAAALIAAGAMLHILGDLGAPSRVRGDEAAHLEPLGNDPDDLGSRFEHVAALAYGRLGVPGPSRVITRDHLRDYFVGRAPGKEGLADEIASHYFSPGTLPERTHVLGDAKPRLARPLPALPARLNLMTASRGDATLRDMAGTCLARYRVDHDVLSFSIDDDCVLEQLAAILPEVEAYETGLLDFLLRGELTLTIGQSVVVSGKGFGPGAIELYVEDERGVRTRTAQLQTQGEKDPVVRVPLPSSGTRVVALFRGADEHGEPVIAIGSAAMPSH